jgi:hypothetical protein
MRLGSGIPDPGVKKAPDPGSGSGSATLVFNEKGQKFSEFHYATSTTKKEGGGH